MKINLGCILFLIAVITAPDSYAVVRLPSLIANDMVLQRDTPVILWGWADPSEIINVEMAGNNLSTITDSGGKWKLTLPPHAAGGPHTIIVNDIRLTGVLFGDVWLCSGQSNMELPVRRTLDLYGPQVEKAVNPDIREFKVALRYDFHAPQDKIPAGQWKSVTPENVLGFSAVGYFFAQELYARHKVPIGLINSAVGGSPIEAWMSESALANFPYYQSATRQCAVDSYVDSVRSAESKRSSNWYSELNAKDAGFGAWYKNNTDISTWQQMNVPGYWADSGAGAVNGVFWFRKTFGVPASMTGKKGILRMGTIVDSDSTFVNGVFVGSTSYQYPPRIYDIPAGLLREGENTITVRVVNNGGRGGFVKDKKYRVETGDNHIDFAGNWLYKIGATMPPAPAQTSFQNKPQGLYNAMMAPIANYAVKGIIWYQGESNTSRAAEYGRLLEDMIASWRSERNDPQLPFIYVQLPNFMLPRSEPAESSWAELREAQRQALRIPFTGMAVAIDLGEWNDIHPQNKQDVGRRLALEAERVAYGNNRIVSCGPLYESIEISDGKALITFASAGSGLASDAPLKGFAIAGTDGKFVWAEARIEGTNKVAVWSGAVKNPVAVRYAWADNPLQANLRNKEGLPASPFATN